MRSVKIVVSTFILLLAGYVYAANQMPKGVEARKATSGTTVLADAKGMTLYTFAKDSQDKSNCNGKCAMAWPPLVAPENAKPKGDWSVVTREDGSKQWAFKGMPLYIYAKDTKPGEESGEGAGQGNWHVAKP